MSNAESDAPANRTITSIKADHEEDCCHRHDDLAPLPEQDRTDDHQKNQYGQRYHDSYRIIGPV